MHSSGMIDGIVDALNELRRYIRSSYELRSAAENVGTRNATDPQELSGEAFESCGRC